MKQFLKWIGLKQQLDQKIGVPPFVHEREIWWANIGENIGREINGKNDQFTRPVIIYKKLSRDFYFVIPITTQPQAGTWFVPIQYQGVTAYACLHQARAIDYRRLSTLLVQLDSNTFEKVKKQFQKLYL